MPSDHGPPVGFARRGARAHAPECTPPAFELAVRLGATGVTSEAWLDGSGRVVLAAEPTRRRGLRRVPLDRLGPDELGEGVVPLAELYEIVGAEVHVLLVAGADGVPTGALAEARRVGPAAVRRLWLAGPDLDVVASWRDLDPDVRLVHVTDLERLRPGPERHAARMAELGVDATAMPQTTWTLGLTTLYHRFERLAVATGAEHPPALRAALRAEVDAVVSDHADRLADALARRRAPGGGGLPPG